MRKRNSANIITILGATEAGGLVKDICREQRIMAGGAATLSVFAEAIAISVVLYRDYYGSLGCEQVLASRTGIEPVSPP